MLNLNKRVIDFLKSHSGEKFTARAIAQRIFERFPEECRMKKEKSTFLQSDDDLLLQLAAEIGASRPRIQKQCPEIDIIEERPKKYFYSSEKSLFVQEEPKARFLEQDLYPKLKSYLKSEHQLWGKRIDEKRGSNQHGVGANHWLYPDVVAFEDLSSAWNREVKDCAQECSETQCRLWSFEVKRTITRSNVREAFFQAISNSSWGHFGYLVASEIEGGDTLKELRILSARHGIGVIKLDFENPSESQLIIPALFRQDLDWNHINRLAVENIDFQDFIRSVRHFHQTGDVREAEWDIHLD